MMTNINMVIESFDYWQVLSIDGEVMVKGHRIENKDMVRALQKKLESAGVNLSLEYVFIEEDEE